MMTEQPITLRVTGTRPLLMNSSRTADPLDPVAQRLASLTSKRPKTEADHAEISRVEWYGAFWSHEGRACIPPHVIEATFQAAAKSRRRGAQASAGLIVKEPAILNYEGPSNIDELWKSGSFIHRALVSVAKVRTARTRPCFSNWSATFTAWFLPSLLSEREISELFAVAGFMKGFGDWRPKFGTFLVEVVE
jgi:hypothetical protein